MRICRGNEILGEWPVGEVKRRLADSSLFLSDLYYDENASEWLTLAVFSSKQTAATQIKVTARTCYCGSGLPFDTCHGDGSQY